MARIIPQYRKDKNGKKESTPYAYNIRVFRGYDVNGKEMKPYQKTWRIPEDLKNKNENRIKQELYKVVADFEDACKSRDTETSKDIKTVSSLARYYIALSERDNKSTTTNFYQSMLPLIDSCIGNVKVMDLTTRILNEFYIKLQTEDIRKDKKMRARDNLLRVKAEKKLTNKDLEALTGLGKNTITLAFRKQNVALKTAQAVAKALEYPTNELFQPVLGSEKIGLGTKTIYEYHKFLKAILELAKEEGYITRNPADYARPPRQKHKEAEWLEVAEIRKIMDAVKNEPLKYRIMLLILVETGMRKGELMGLKWHHIDFEKNSIRIRDNLQYSPDKGIYETTPKSGRGRLLAVSPEVIEQLKLYYLEQKEIKDFFSTKKKEYNPKNYLFTQNDGRPMHPTTLYHWFNKMEIKYNLPHLYPHKFRHSQASILFAGGVDVITASKRLGHSQPSTTQDIYAHMLDQMDQKASAAIAAAIWER